MEVQMSETQDLQELARRMVRPGSVITSEDRESAAIELEERVNELLEESNDLFEDGDDDAANERHDEAQQLLRVIVWIRGFHG